MPRIKRPAEHTIEHINHRRIQAFNRAMDRDADMIDRQLDRMAARTRTLKLDEQAKSHTPTTAAVLAAAAVWNEHTIIEEHRDAYLIPREALTVKLSIRLFKPILEFRNVPGRQLDPESKVRAAAIEAELAKRASVLKRIHPDNREAYITQLCADADRMNADFIATATYVHNNGASKELVWKSDTTLLNTRKGFDTLEHITFKRMTSRTKETAIEKESADLPIWDADETPTT